MDFDRIVSVPGILGGKPCIRGTRISVQFILELVASGGSREQIVAQYPELTIQDVEQSLRFAASSITNDQFLRVPVN
jgi:uncharacterized protein (DUF433 family)